MTPLFPSSAVRETETEAARTLATRPPWVPAGTDDGDESRTDRGLRAHVRRHVPGDEPTTEMVFGLGRSLKREHLDGISDDGVRRLALVTHLLSLLPATGRPAPSVGAACARAGMLPSRFARLADTPRAYRAEALARAFRQIGAAGVRLGADAMPGLMDVLFSPDHTPGGAPSATRAVTGWARDFFHTADPAETTDDATAA